MNRRESLLALTGGLLLPSLHTTVQANDENPNDITHIATNTYPWRTFAKRAKQSYDRHTDNLLRKIKATGITGYEPIIESPQELDGLGARLEQHGLTMRSIYVNSVLHDEAQSQRSIEDVLAICHRLSALGTQMVVTNPSPIRWGGPENKTDPELERQASALNHLGGELRRLGLTLAYHNHDAELREGAREFHHMLTATDPKNVKFCLDAHWIFRGCGNSQVALFDAVSHYQNRIVELHLRQSNQGIWTESFSPDGDINYRRLFQILKAARIHPHFVLEQAVEAGSTNQLTVTEAHRQGRRHLLQSLT